MTTLINGDFVNGLNGWAVWNKRGHPLTNITPEGIQFEAHHETYEAGLLQSVSGGPLARFKLTAWVRFTLSDPVENPDFTGIRAWVGIDPAGGTHPDSTGIVAVSADVGRYAFQPITVEAESVRGDVTVFVGVEAGVANQWRIANLYATIGRVELEISPSVPPPPKPVPILAESITLDNMHISEDGKSAIVTLRIPVTKSTGETPAG